MTRAEIDALPRRNYDYALGDADQIGDYTAPYFKWNGSQAGMMRHVAYRRRSTSEMFRIEETRGKPHDCAVNGCGFVCPVFG